jgi:hypothetical protein
VFGFHEFEHFDALMDLVERVAEAVVFVAGVRGFEASSQLLAKSRKRLAFLGGLVSRSKTSASWERAAFVVQTGRGSCQSSLDTLRVYGFSNIRFFECIASL